MQTPLPRVLLGPGPSSISPKVQEALSRAPIGYLDPELFEITDRIRARLRTVFGTQNAFTIPLTGTGMAGMECCFANVIEPADKVLVGIHGFFGHRMAEIARRLGADVITVEAEWGEVLEPAAIAKALDAAGKVKLVACVHAETSTGICQPLEEIAKLAREHGALFLVDTVTSLGGMPVEVDRLGIDISYSATQKCIGAPSGISPITVSERAWAVRQQRRAPVEWYFDWVLLKDYYDAPHTYHHTVPANLLYALDAALEEIEEEGLEERWRRHVAVSTLLREQLKELGIKAFGRAEHRLPTLNAFYVPDAIDNEANVRARLLQDYGIEIGGGLGKLKGKIWRIGTMGSSATPRNVLLLSAALRTVLN
ncbi:pyridoxal-phosphate-dependent aminotransferase family protein [Chthonomonas calidirosea]|uniref:pyridoxal-phosphate-dependent aminotransferase family protein n=1 Tax=Chthonomonas calidirosea TaxID=454171 RepID=UPI0006ECA2D4|nr:alanine--glyoxylate aminotransferase family protein [Chthonomonas calidirosea]CEK13995.1 alanine-glyoxylate aminotransferase apoenzyme [Chthonomonas calidirosea]